MSEIYNVRSTAQSVVLLGGFSATNFTLERLNKYGILSDAFMEDSEMKFFSDGRITLQMPFATLAVGRVDELESKLSIQSTDEGTNQLFRDFVLSLMNLFDTTAVTGMGLNYVSEIQHIDEKQWHSFGHNIVPKNKFENVFSFAKKDVHCGLTHASIRFESPLESVEKLDSEEVTELNVAIRPILNDVNGASQTRVSEIRLNYHFPINANSGMFMALKTYERYGDELSESYERQIDQIVRENTDV